ncbi:MAG: Cache 3/Cache 2 fusion domain-containing protein [Spirochaetes bacterium]|nr:Cache 3/Cache 2 fusion domain-containing protein [Spirochaetota bacterium]
MKFFFTRCARWDMIIAGRLPAGEIPQGTRRETEFPSDAMDPLSYIRKIRNRITFKLIAAFFLTAGISASIFFVVNYILVRSNLKRTVTSDLQTSVQSVHALVAQRYSDEEYEPRRGEPDRRFRDLRRVIKSLTFGSNGYAFVVNDSGELLIHPDQEGQDLSEQGFIQDMLARKSGVIEYDWEGERKIVAFTRYEPLGWTIAAGGYYRDFVDRPMNGILLWSVIIIIIEIPIIFIVLYRVISSMLITPIGRARFIASRIGEGDLTVDASDRGGADEVSVMIRTMAGILTAQRNIIAAMANHIGKLTDSSEKMARISNRMSKMSQDQASAMEETSAALEETLASMEQIASRSENQYQNVDQNAARMARMASEAQDSYREAIRVTDLITATSESALLGEKDLNVTVEEMQKIKESTSKIAEIIKIISDISEQVNLLSLNAAIEAARAGDQGKGFAVVADEISKLADETAMSAKNITQLVKEGSAQVDSGTNIVNRTAQTFHKIIESIESVRSIIAGFSGTLSLLAETASEARGKTDVIKQISNDISMSTKEQMTTNKEISSTIERVNADSQELVNYADEILATSQEIGELSAEIKMQIEKFRIE